MKRFSWPLIIFSFLWLNVVLPGHTRGVLTLCAEKGAKPAMATGCCKPGTSKQSDSPTQEQKKNCAICYFAAGLMTPPVVSFDHLYLQLQEVSPAPLAQSAPNSPLVLSCTERGPPQS